MLGLDEGIWLKVREEFLSANIVRYTGAQISESESKMFSNIRPNCGS